jgi:SM-20-related protein
MVTVRSNCQAKDGRIHADATFKLATLLLYLNEPWSPQGGRLRGRRSATDMEDYAAEVAPEGGLLFCFKVQPNRQPRQDGSSVPPR